MTTKPQCPACQHEMDSLEFESADVFISPVNQMPAVDLLLRCPHCQATLNMFPSLLQFEVYPT